MGGFADSYTRAELQAADTSTATTSIRLDLLDTTPNDAAFFRRTPADGSSVDDPASSLGDLIRHCDIGVRQILARCIGSAAMPVYSALSHQWHPYGQVRCSVVPVYHQDLEDIAQRINHHGNTGFPTGYPC